MGCNPLDSSGIIWIRVERPENPHAVPRMPSWVWSTDGIPRPGGFLVSGEVICNGARVDPLGSFARSPGRQEQAEVSGADHTVVVQVALWIVGVPAGEKVLQVLDIDGVVATVDVASAVVAP